MSVFSGRAPVMKSVSRGFDSRSGRLIFPVFVLLLFRLRHMRVSLSDV